MRKTERKETDKTKKWGWRDNGIGGGVSTEEETCGILIVLLPQSKHESCLSYCTVGNVCGRQGGREN